MSNLQNSLSNRMLVGKNEGPMNTKTSTKTDGQATDAALWSIADVERETGLGKDTLRVWEKRYGFPVPLRDALGERAYPDEQLARLRMIKRLLDSNHRPGKVVAQPIDVLQALLDNLPDTAAAASPQATDEGMMAEDPGWIEWLSQDKTHQIKQSLQQHILRNGLAHVVDKIVAPLCGMVGMAWMRGEISVYQEHLFTEVLQSVLREAIASVDAVCQGQRQQPRVLLTTTPGEMHGLGLLMAECHFALESCDRFVLGTSTPISDMVQAVRQLKIDVLALSFSAYASRKDVVDNLQLLREQLPASVEIWAGGAAANNHSRLLPQGVVLMRKAGDVAVQVQSWRSRFGPGLWA